MAVVSFNGLQIRDEFIRSGYMDFTREADTIFNQVGFGAFQYAIRFKEGLHPESSYFTEPANLVSRRDALATNNDDQTAKKLSESLQNGVKLFRKAGLVEIRMGDLRQRKMSMNEWLYLIGRAYGRQKMVDYLNTMINCATTIIGKETANVINHGGDTFKVEFLSELAEKFAGAEQNLACYVTHSKMRYVLQREEYQDNVYQVGKMMISGGNPLTWGVPVVYLDNDNLEITDADSVAAGNQAGYKILAMNKGAFQVAQDDEVTQHIDIIGGKENLAVTIQREWEYSLSAQGYSFDNTKKNPTDTDLYNSANWTKDFTDSRELVGFELQVKRPPIVRAAS